MNLIQNYTEMHLTMTLGRNYLNTFIFVHYISQLLKLFGQVNTFHCLVLILFYIFSSDIVKLLLYVVIQV